MADYSQLSDDQIMQMLRPAPASAPTLDPSKMSDDQLMAAIRAPAQTAPQPGMLESLWRGAAQGATLGGGDEAYAAARGAAAKVTGGEFGSTYDQQLAETQANNKAAADANPWTYTAGQVAGAIPGLVYGGTTALGAKALGLVGRNLATRSVVSGLSGAGIGTVQGFAGTDGDADQRMSGAGWGGLAGAGLGGAAPAVGQAVGAGARAIMNNFRPPVQGVPNAAVRMLGDDVAAAGGSRAIQQRMAELGPDAMLLDASPSFTGRAQGLAVRPETREPIQDALAARNASTNARLRGDLDQTLGPAPVPSQVEGQLAAGRTALGPEYDAVFDGARAVDTRGLAAQLEEGIINSRGRAQAAMREVRQSLDIPGNPGNLDPNPRALFATRQAIDGRLSSEADSNAIRVLTAARQQVDDELARVVPGIKAVDARYAELARQSEALTKGASLLDSGRTATRPQEMGRLILEGIEPKGQMVGPSASTFRMRQGLRADIDREVGTKANDLVALRNVVKGEGDWNRAKLADVFGQDRADKILASVDREAAFRDAYTKVVENAQTAQRTLAAAGMEPRGAGSAADNIGTVIAGAVGGPQAAGLAMAARGLNAANRQAMSASDIARNKEIARILLGKSGPEMSALLERLGQGGLAGRRATAIGDKTGMLAQVLLESQGALGGDKLRVQAR